MNDADRDFLLAVSGLLHYPGDDFFMQTRSVEELCDLLPVVRACPLRAFIRASRSLGLTKLRQDHVAVFDMDKRCGLSLAWHRRWWLRRRRPSARLRVDADWRL